MTTEEAIIRLNSLVNSITYTNMLLSWAYILSEDVTAIKMAIKALSEQGQLKQKLGKWVDDGDPLSWVCSECGYRVARYNDTPYCPNCGVKMINLRGEQNDEQRSD